MGSKSLTLERNQRGGGKVMLIIPLSPSNKCSCVHEPKHLQLLKWSHSTAGTMLADRHGS